jgi:glycosyltransferase involved in cell wall biosynthesis
MISVVILTLNEEKNLAACLESIKWCDDVLIVDSYSSDKTLEIAEFSGASIIQHRFDGFASQRNYAIENHTFKYDWVLHLDADERVSDELCEEIKSVTVKVEKPAYRIASMMMFCGKWLKHAGMYPAYQVRLGRKDFLRFVQAGHGQREDAGGGQIGTLKSPLIHYCFSKGLTDWFEKHNRYSRDESLWASKSSQDKIDWPGIFSMNDGVRRRRALKDLSFRLPFRPTLRFLYMYVAHLGFLDGWQGFTYCRLLSIYEYMTLIKIKEIELARKGVTI